MMSEETMNFHEAMEQVSERFDNLIAEDILFTPLNYEQIAAKYGLETKYVQRLATKRGISRPKGSGSPAHPRHKKATVLS
jgi:hypothetical protein